MCGGIRKELTEIDIDIHLDTSEDSKKHSEKVIEELGGSGTQEATRNNPVSKSAAEELYGSRAAAG